MESANLGKKSLLFLSFFWVISGTSMDVSAQGLIELPRTGQTISYYPGDDGDIEEGIPWPSPRFTDNGNETITDNLTGLIWTKNANLPGITMKWEMALDYISKMNSGTYENFGFNDWRLPNIIELESLFNSGVANTRNWLMANGFKTVMETSPGPGASWHYYYWSSTLKDYSGAWTISFSDDNYMGGWSLDSNAYVWPVRGDTSGPALLWNSGKTKCLNKDGQEIYCLNTGQDGEIQAGIAWPIPRFTTFDDCVMDNLTGLIWAKIPDTVTRAWRDALEYANNLNLCGFSEWRLPNRKEFFSLFDFSYPPYVDGLFTYIDGNYWTSTTSSQSGGAFVGTLTADFLRPVDKSNDDCCYAWPVLTPDVAEYITTPPPPYGSFNGIVQMSYLYSAGSSESNYGHPLQYRFDWGDGTFSDWSTSASATKAWASPGIYLVKGQARCSINTSVVSEWSEPFQVTITLVGPDLTGSWTIPLTQTCRTIGKNQRCSLKGTFTVSNNGNKDASSTYVNIYLSDNGTYDEGDTLFRSFATGRLKPGKFKVIRLIYNLQLNQNVTGKHIIVVIDKDSMVTEIDETNNTVTSGPIP